MPVGGVVRDWQAAAALAAVVLGVGGMMESPAPASAITEEQLLFLEAWRAVDRAYVDKSFNGQAWFRVREQYLKKERMVERSETYAAIEKLLSSLDDPFTRFLEPLQYSLLRRGTSGSVTGIGVEVGFDTQASGTDADLLVVAPAPGGPADRAGLRPRDVILAIDGAPVRGLSLYEVAAALQGESGSTVQLSVAPAGSPGPARSVSVAREKVKIQPVTQQKCTGVAGGDIGFIRISTFNKSTPDGVRAALSDLKAQGAQRFVIDVRNNGGGFFPAGLAVAKLWIQNGDIVLIADSQGVKDIYTADGTALDPESPLAVLVNRGTASASEVLAAALQDNGRALILGDRTFGKGLIQTVVPLSDGSAVVVTVARYQTPLGTDINKTGITPDVPLRDDALPYLVGDACSALAAPGAPQLFR